MKCLLLTPTYFPLCTGNAVTVNRIAHLLSQRRIQSDIVNLAQTPPEDLPERVRQSAPDLLHAFHALKAGIRGLKLHERFDIPLITTLTGTDINLDIADPERRRIMMEVLHGSAAITIFQDDFLPRLVRLGIPRNKIRVIHQSVFFPAGKKVDYRAKLHLSRQTTVILMLGALRKVKRLGYAIDVMKAVRRRYPDFHLLLAGPVLDPETMESLHLALRVHRWITYLGEVPRDQIHALLGSCDILLNTSRSESESNAILEALSRGCLVIARDIPGNAYLKTGAAGLLFRNKHNLYDQTLQALEQPDLLAPVRKNARRLITTAFNPEREGAAYAELYGSVLSAHGAQER